MRLTRVALSIAAVGAALIPLLPQTAVGQRPSFEVVALHRSPETTGIHIQMAICRGIDTQLSTALPIEPPPLGRCTLRLWTLRGMIGTAYFESTAMLDQLVLGGPAWVSEDAFDLDGKAENSSTATESELKAMLQTFLAETFKLQFHKVQKQLDGFALTSTGKMLKSMPTDDKTFRSFQADAAGCYAAD